MIHYMYDIQANFAIFIMSFTFKKCICKEYSRLNEINTFYLKKVWLYLLVEYVPAQEEDSFTAKIFAVPVKDGRLCYGTDCYCHSQLLVVTILKN